MPHEMPEPVAPGSSADDEANQPIENFDSYPDEVALFDSLHNAENLEDLAQALEQNNNWPASSGESIDGKRVAHQIRELDHLLGLDPSDEVQAHIDNLVRQLPLLPDLQDTVVRIMNRGEN